MANDDAQASEYPVGTRGSAWCKHHLEIVLQLEGVVASLPLVLDCVS